MNIRALLLFIILLIAMTLSTTAVDARDRDPLAPIEEMEAHQFEAFPPEAVAPENAEAITKLVNEARLFGVPVSVRVVELPSDHSALSAFSDIDTSSPIPAETVREMAQAWMAEEPIESSPDAADGFLLFVAIPEDPTRSVGVFEMGPNALPLNGLTQENIDAVVDEIIMPSFAENRISQGIRLGLSVFSYNNLFGEPARLEQDELHQDLQLAANIPLAGITVLSSLGLVGFSLWLHRRAGGGDARGSGEHLSPLAVGALHEGRVNDAVLTGGLLMLIRTGVLIPGTPGTASIRIAPARESSVNDPYARTILAILQRYADETGAIPPAVVRNLPEILRPVRHQVEDDLARHGLFNRRGRIETAWLFLGSALVGGIALFTLLPSILGMARYGVFAIVFAAACIAGVVVWALRRSWTSTRGEDALDEWLTSADPQDRVAFDLIANQDVLISAQGGPDVPATVNLVRELRGIGAT